MVRHRESHRRTRRDALARRPESPATDLCVTFTADGGGTRVELFHTGWEAYGDGGAEPSGSYSVGWDTVLGHYTRFTAT